MQAEWDERKRRSERMAHFNETERARRNGVDVYYRPLPGESRQGTIHAVDVDAVVAAVRLDPDAIPRMAVAYCGRRVVVDSPRMQAVAPLLDALTIDCDLCRTTYQGRMFY